MRALWVSLPALVVAFGLIAWPGSIATLAGVHALGTRDVGVARVRCVSGSWCAIGGLQMGLLRCRMRHARIDATPKRITGTQGGAC